MKRGNQDGKKQIMMTTLSQRKNQNGHLIRQNYKLYDRE